MKASQPPAPPDDYEEEEDPLAVVDLTDETQQTLLAPSVQQSLTDDFDEAAFESHFGLIPAEDLVIIRPYSGEEDETTLQDIRPRFIVMYDPDPAFIRRVEVSVSVLTTLFAPHLTEGSLGVSEYESRLRCACLLYDLSRFGRGTEIPERSEEGKRCL